MSKKTNNNVEMHSKHSYNFKANNNLGAREIFDRRKNYRDSALYDKAELSFHQGTIDLLVDDKMTFFGRIDEKNVPRYLRFSHMKSFDYSVVTPGEGLTSKIYAVNFVVDAFTDMAAELRKMVLVSHCGLKEGDISLKPKIGRIDSYATAQLIFGKYTLSDFNFYSTSATEDITGRGKLDKIRTFDDMVKNFLKFTDEKSGLSMPITHTGTMLHPAGSIQMTGLAVLLQPGDQSQDESKSGFLNDEFFDLYRRLAVKYGFLVDRNCPWRLIADITSPHMKKYMDVYDLTAKNLFDKYYIKAYELDLGLIKKQFTSLWNNLVTNYPKYTYRNRGCGSGLADRERLTEADIEAMYDEIYWLPVYVKLRNMEVQSGLSDVSIARIQKHAIELAKALDTSSAMEYINRQFQQFYLNQRMAGEKFMPFTDMQAEDQSEQELKERISMSSGGSSAISGY